MEYGAYDKNCSRYVIQQPRLLEASCAIDDRSPPCDSDLPCSSDTKTCLKANAVLTTVFELKLYACARSIETARRPCRRQSVDAPLGDNEIHVGQLAVRVLCWEV